MVLNAAPAPTQLIREVRAEIARDDFAAGERRIADYRAARGVTPEMLEAHSWLGRGALAAKRLDAAEAYATQTREMSLAELKKRPLDAERHLPIALGASIEVHAQVLAARGAVSEAVAFLERELETYGSTSIHARIRKNINLLSLVGKPAPPLEMREYLGAKPLPLAKYRGRPLLLFFWAHWCIDCKQQAPALARLQAEYGRRGLRILGPTQYYGYVARGEDAEPAAELPYIERIRKEHYGALTEMPVPVSQGNFRLYGCSTTPTLVLVDREGIVRLYHPGHMPYEKLAAAVESVIGR